MSPEALPRRGCWLIIFGGLLFALSSLLETTHVLYQLNFSFFQELGLPSKLKMFLSLCIFLGLTCMALAFASVYFQRKGFTRASSALGVFASILALINAVVPLTYGYETYPISAVWTILGVCLMAVGVELASYSPSIEWRGPLLTSKEVAVTTVLSAVYATLIIVVRVPSPTGGYTHVGDVIVFVAALLFGCKVGGLVGAIGAVAADFYVGYERWFVSILAHGLEGLIPGFSKGKSLTIQALTCIIGGFIMATTYFIINVFIKGYPVAIISYMRDLFIQAGLSIVIGLAIANTVRRSLPQLQ
ncbi:MAG: ECF transporter S component [Candidatus Bathyarchaeia archaeon]